MAWLASVQLEAKWVSRIYSGGSRHETPHACRRAAEADGSGRQHREEREHGEEVHRGHHRQDAGRRGPLGGAHSLALRTLGSPVQSAHRAQWPLHTRVGHFFILKN